MTQFSWQVKGRERNSKPAVARYHAKKAVPWKIWKNYMASLQERIEASHNEK